MSESAGAASRPTLSSPEGLAVREAARRGEPDRYLAATLAPVDIRMDLAAIAAFAAELGRIPATVSEPMLGSIRLQWWRDTLSAARSDRSDRLSRTGHPIADAVAAAATHHTLDAGLFDAMIEAREMDLTGGLPTDDVGLWAYLDAIEGHPFRLAFAIAGTPPSLAGPLATAAGRAYGLARALGRLPMLLHNGGLPLPVDRLRAAGVDPVALLASPRPPDLAAGMAQVVAALTALARQEVAVVRKLSGALPRRSRAVLLPVAMVGPYFRAQSPGTSLDLMTAVSPLTRVVRIGLAHMAGSP